MLGTSKEVISLVHERMAAWSRAGVREVDTHAYLQEPSRFG